MKPEYYAFRWITLLLTQEFNFQSIMRIWDSLLSNPFGVQVFLYSKPKGESHFASLFFYRQRMTQIHERFFFYIVLSALHFLQDMLLRVCCAMLLCIKSSLLSGDFVTNLKLLQHYPDINIERLLQVAQDFSPDTSSYRLSP